MPKYIELGSKMFVHKDQKAQGMKEVHKITVFNYKEFMKGIKEDDYDFYDDYMDCREVLIVGSSNCGKSTLINELNSGT